MKWRSTIAFVVIAISLSVAQTEKGSGKTSGSWTVGQRILPTILCGIPGVSATLCSSFNITTGLVPLPNPIPAWGPNSTTAAGGNPYLMQNVGNLTGAGVSVTPSDFHRPILRCTDSTMFVSANQPWGLADNGENNLFSSDDQFLIIKARAGTQYLVSISATGVCSPVSGITYSNSGDVDFAHATPNVIYSLQGTTFNQLYQDTISVTGCPSACAGTIVTHTLLYDFATSNCLLNSFNGNPSWGGGASTGLMAISLDDSTVTIDYADTGISGQSGRWVASWRKSYGLSGKCDLWDTQAGTYQANAGTTGSVVITPASSAGDKFKIHEAFQTLNNSYATVSAASNLMISGTYVPQYYGWQIGTATVVHCGQTSPTIDCSGHWGDGFLGSVVGKNGTYHLYTDASTPLTNSTPGGAPCGDAHMSWNFDNITDGYPPLVTEQDNNFAGPHNLATVQTTPPCAYWDELYFGNQGSGNVLRVAHTYNSGWSWSFDTQNGGVGIESPTGKWAAFLSDGWGQFGSTAGNAKCNIGAPDWYNSDSTDYVTGTGFGSFAQPSTGNAGNYIYHIASCSGTCATGATHPTWPQTATPHTTVVDNTITWETYPDSFTSTISAVSNCRAEVMLVKLFD